MGVFENDLMRGHERVCFARDDAVGLRTIVAVHSTKLGPAGGGLRFFPYANSDDALADVLRLSRAMSYKMALAGLPYGGGKSVIIGDPKTLKSEALLEAYGRVVENLGGLYFCGEDVGTTPEDMTVIRRTTKNVAGLPETSGDPSPATAYGVYHAMRAAVEHKLHRDDFKGLRVAVQGLGHVGRHLCKHLAEQGAELKVADIDPEAVQDVVKEFGATEAPPEKVLGLDVDVLAPCAMGGVLTDKTVGGLQAKVICGAANNQLAGEDQADQLAERGILYVPDFLANSGGAISATGPFLKVSEKDVWQKVAAIHDTCDQLFDLAEREGITPNEAAEHMAEQAMA